MNLQDFINQNREKLDIYDLKPGHEERFLAKLKQKKRSQKPGFVKRHYRKLLVAASVLLLIATGRQYYKFVQYKQMQDVEIQQSEKYFSGIIQAEISHIKAGETPETQKVFNDAMQQITQLEKDYRTLVKDYRLNHDKYILNAMIENFQQRIDILQFVRQEIKKIKETKTQKDETHRA